MTIKPWSIILDHYSLVCVILSPVLWGWKYHP